MRLPVPDPDADLEAAFHRVLVAVGEDPTREGLLETPGRMARSMRDLTEGYALDPVAILKDALFDTEADEMVVVRDLEFFSLCEHHGLPFYGRAHIAYIPGHKIVGLSKLARVLDAYSHRLQVQERLTTQVAAAIEEAVAPKGVGVVLEAYHLCMMMRGVQKQGARAVTSCMLGLFKRDARTRAEFLQLIKGDTNA